jgi:arylsulfatase A-like enzyme
LRELSQVESLIDFRRFMPFLTFRTGNVLKLAAEGLRFPDCYAEASCTAGRAAVITGELSIHTGLTTVGQAGAKLGLPAEAMTLATALKDLG